MRSKFLVYLGVTLALAAKYSYLMLTVPLPCSGEKVMTTSRNKRRRRDFYNQISKNLLGDTENDTDMDSVSNIQEKAWWNRVHQTFGPQQNACRLKLYWEKGYFWQEGKEVPLVKAYLTSYLSLSHHLFFIGPTKKILKGSGALK